MTNAHKLRCWAQNEEMVNQFYTQHGKDCLLAADELERLEAEHAKLKEALRDLREAYRLAGHLHQRVPAAITADSLLRELGE